MQLRHWRHVDVQARIPESDGDVRQGDDQPDQDREAGTPVAGDQAEH